MKRRNKSEMDILHEEAVSLMFASNEKFMNMFMTLLPNDRSTILFQYASKTYDDNWFHLNDDSKKKNKKKDQIYTKLKNMSKNIFWCISEDLRLLQIDNDFSVQKKKKQLDEKQLMKLIPMKDMNACHFRLIFLKSILNTKNEMMKKNNNLVEEYKKITKCLRRNLRKKVIMLS